MEERQVDMCSGLLCGFTNIPHLAKDCPAQSWPSQMVEAPPDATSEMLSRSIRAREGLRDALAAKDSEIARLRTLYEEQLDHCAGVIAKQDGFVEAMRAKCEAYLHAQSEAHHATYARNPSSQHAPLHNFAGDELERCADAIAALKAK